MEAFQRIMLCHWMFCQLLWHMFCQRVMLPLTY